MMTETTKATPTALPAFAPGTVPANPPTGSKKPPRPGSMSWQFVLEAFKAGGRLTAYGDKTRRTLPDGTPAPNDLYTMAPHYTKRNVVGAIRVLRENFGYTVVGKGEEFTIVECLPPDPPADPAVPPEPAPGDRPADISGHEGERNDAIPAPEAPAPEAPARKRRSR